MIKARSFPRYNVKSYPLDLKINEYAGEKLNVTEISVGGMRVENIDSKKLGNGIQAEMSYDKYHFEFQLTPVWNEGSRVTGFKIEFENLEFFKKWILLIRSLHHLRMKRKGK